MRVEPVGEWILVEKRDPGKTKGGLYILSDAKGDIRAKLYEVIEVGEDCERVAVGDCVVFSSGAEAISKVPVDGRDLLLIREQWVVARVVVPGEDATVATAEAN